MKIDTGFASRLLEGARKKGADHAEVFLKSSKKLSVEVKEQKVEALESSVDFGYALRIIRDKRLGFSYSTDMNDADSVIASAIEASRWAEHDDYLDLPESSEHQTLLIFDDAIASMSEEDAFTKALIIEKTALDFDRRIRRVRKASASFSNKDVLIMNSKGLNKTYSATACTSQIMAVAEDAGDSQMGWEFEGSRFLSDISFENVGRGAAKRALLLLGSKKMKSVKTQVILENSVAIEFLGIFASLLSSENVQKGKSLLAKRLKQRVISPVISVLDDGCMERKLGSRPFDDEGVPTSGKYLIKDGLLQGYMYNVYTAKKDGLMSTGNAVKGGFSSLPAIGPSNLYINIHSGSVKPGNLFAIIDKGLYITEAMGIHTANPVSGEFSIGVSGLWIEKGNIKYPVKEAIISGNILDFFSKVEAGGDDFRFYGNLASPSLLIGPTDISA